MVGGVTGSWHPVEVSPFAAAQQLAYLHVISSRGARWMDACPQQISVSDGVGCSGVVWGRVGCGGAGCDE